VEEMGSSRETSPLQLLEELCFRRDERNTISPGTVSHTRRKFETASSSSEVESDKFARERASTEKLSGSGRRSCSTERLRSCSTEKLRGILRSEKDPEGSSGLSSVSLLLLGSRQHQQEQLVDGTVEGLSPIDKMKVLFCYKGKVSCIKGSFKVKDYVELF
jgi:hypothetical protein